MRYRSQGRNTRVTLNRRTGRHILQTMPLSYAHVGKSLSPHFETPYELLSCHDVVFLFPLPWNMKDWVLHCSSSIGNNLQLTDLPMKQSTYETDRWDLPPKPAAPRLTRSLTWWLLLAVLSAWCILQGLTTSVWLVCHIRQRFWSSNTTPN